ncbi:hypothetical protein LOK49_LG06G02211 [Camellia lanceoleosa]|uniref:Uncharacterized protein n=1 Tax=Camellia lanceoleosa TaxID=1840588 RepID=A0ACC0H9C5_9ERIC|nr:hypothetical protein LOK49_LG06G02211 [Camellia lanceoleosa]
MVTIVPLLWKFCFLKICNIIKTSPTTSITSPTAVVLDRCIINDRETGRSRGFGFMTFKDEQSMRDAIEGMNGQDLDGRNITVNDTQSRRNSSGRGGGFRGGGGGCEGGYGGGGCR